jgi:hypothetical protein
MQIVSVQILNILGASYVIRVRPFGSPNLNNLEVFNEVIMYLCTLFLISFKDETNKYQTELGWVYLGIIFFYVLVNLIETIKDLIKAIVLKITEKFGKKQKFQVSS